MRRFALALPLAFPLAACPGESEDMPSLARFESCSELESFVRDSARKKLDFVDTRYGNVMPMEGDVAMRGGETMEDAGGAAGAPSAAPVVGGGGNRAYSTTNVQEDGVDEADFVKNDGDHMFVVDGTGMSIYDLWPAEDLQQVGRVELEGTPTSLYFDAVDTVVAFSMLQIDAQPESGGSPSFGPDWEGGVSYDPVSKVTVIDVADRAAPEVVRELYLDGSLATSRRVGDKLHIVLQSTLEDVLYGDDLDGSPMAQTVRRGRITQAKAETWIPRMYDAVKSSGRWTETSGPVAACTDVYKPNLRTELQFTTVATLDLADPSSPLLGAGVMARTDVAYATADTLYTAMTEWNWGPFRDRNGTVETRIYKFALDGDGGVPLNTAAGLVPGSMLNQFSMDEWQGDLRVAATLSSDSTSSSVYVLEDADGRLLPVGQIDGIAPDESIFAVRFVDDKGYVVTFERIDPLFTLDLSDRTAPRIVGELEVTGFSNYIHPLGDTHLIAIGEELGEDGFSWEGAQVSLFDVSDFAAPQLQDREIVGGGQSSSAAQYDHHAFTWYEEHDTLAIPVMSWDSWGLAEDGLELLRITEEEGIESLGALDHSVILEAEDDQWSWCTQVRRSVFVDDVVYAVSSYGIQAAMADEPETTVAALRLPSPSCNWYWGWGGVVAEDFGGIR